MQHRSPLAAKPGLAAFVIFALGVGNTILWRDDVRKAFERTQDLPGCPVGKEPNRTSTEIKQDFAAALDGSYQPTSSNPCVEGGCTEHHTDYRDRCKKDVGDSCNGWWWQNEWVYRQTRIYYQCPSSGGWVWRVACLDWDRTGDCCRTSNTQLPSCTGASGEPSCEVPWPPL
jgi:hypothetical protein